MMTCWRFFRPANSSSRAGWVAALGAPVLALVACSSAGDEADPPPSFNGTGGASTAVNAVMPGAGGSGTGDNGSVASGAGGSSGGAPSNGGGAAPTGQNGIAGSAAGLAGASATDPNAGSAGAANAGSAGSANAGSAGAGNANGGSGGSGNTPPVTNPSCADLLLCDDFETATPGASPDPARWSLSLNYNPNAPPSPDVSVDNTVSHGGSQSVRINGSGEPRDIVATVPVDRLFVRAFLRLSSAPTGGGPVLMAVGGDQNSDVRLRLWAGQVATLNTGNGDSIVPNAATSGNCPECLNVPSDTWFCAEMFVDNAQQSVILWIDEAEAGRVTNNDWNSTWPTFPAQTNVRLGFWGLQGANATTVWIDDVAIGSERIGCN